MGNFKVKPTTISEKDNPDDDEVGLTLSKPNKLNDKWIQIKKTWIDSSNLILVSMMTMKRQREISK